MDIVPAPSVLSTEDPRYLNRELSWLDFNARVLALAEDPGTPLLERAKFLAIFGQNLDEFFQVRVSGLKEQASAGVGAATPDGHDAARAAARDPRAGRRAGGPGRRRCSTRRSLPALDEAGIRIVDWDELDDDDRDCARPTVFDERIFPVLTPLAGRPRAPVPLHLQPVAEPRGRRARPDDGRSGGSRA